MSGGSSWWSSTAPDVPPEGTKKREGRKGSRRHVYFDDQGYTKPSSSTIPRQVSFKAMPTNAVEKSGGAKRSASRPSSRRATFMARVGVFGPAVESRRCSSPSGSGGTRRYSVAPGFNPSALMSNRLSARRRTRQGGILKPIVLFHNSGMEYVNSCAASPASAFLTAEKLAEHNWASANIAGSAAGGGGAHCLRGHQAYQPVRWRDGVMWFPSLKFVNPGIEHLYVCFLASLYKARCFFGGLVVFTCIALHFAILLPVLTWHSELFHHLYLVLVGIMLIVTLAFTLIGFFLSSPGSRNARCCRGETFAIISIYVIISLLMVQSEILVYFTDAIDIENNAVVFQYFLILLCLFTFHALVPLRACVAFLGNILALLTALVAMLLAAFVYEDTNDAWLRMGVVMIWLVLGSVVQWIVEMRDREMFYSLLAAHGRLTRAKKAVATRRHEGSSALESLVDTLKKGLNSLECIADRPYISVDDVDFLLETFNSALRIAAKGNLYEAGYGSKKTADMLRAWGVTSQAEPYGRSTRGARGSARHPSGASCATHQSSATNAIQPEYHFNSQLGELPDAIGSSWHLDIVNLKTPRVLMDLAMILLSPYFHAYDSPHTLHHSPSDLNLTTFGGPETIAAPRGIQTSQGALANFIGSIEDQYLPNPYHSSSHAAQVMHSTTCLIKSAGVLDGMTLLEEVAVLIAAMCHDVAHPGRTNLFMINTAHELAITYNDISVLENFHGATAFRTLKKTNHDIFASLAVQDFKHVRKKIVDLILATDMSGHCEYISLCRVRMASPDFDVACNEADTWLVTKLCIKAGDISHSALPWAQHHEWSLRVTEEFYRQGDEEQLLGLPKSALCDRDQHSALHKSQLGFLDFVVKPLFVLLDEVGAVGDETVRRFAVGIIDDNISRWMLLGERGSAAAGNFGVSSVA